MATNIELKQNIDTNIINKTATSSITKVDVGNMGKDIIDYVDQEINNVQEPIPGPAGQQGIQGNTGQQGPQGNPGPIGPAGLTWKGQWVSGNSYVEDDAVGHNGASWFCIADTSGTTPPNADLLNWALLASQGAQGIQGATGLTGPQGIPGTAAVLNHKKLVGKLTQSGLSAPVMTIFENTFEGTPTIAYTSVGGYVISLPGTNDFNKFYAIIGSDSSSVQTKTEIVKAFTGFEFVAFVRTYNSSANNTPEDSRLNSTPFEIRIYN